MNCDNIKVCVTYRNICIASTSVQLSHVTSTNTEEDALHVLRDLCG